MAIKKKNTTITIIILLFTVVLNNQLTGQTIKIQSLDGKNQEINVVHDPDRDILTIATLRDTLHIEDCIVVEEVNALNKNFVKIIYQARGGSGIHLRRMIILTSKNNKLYQSLQITSLFKEEFIDYSKSPASSTPDKSSLYEVKINLPNTDYHNQKIIASIHSAEKVKDHPQNDYNKENNVTLIFDTVKNVFYSNNADVSRYFTIYDPKTQHESKQYVSGTFPTIQLGNYNYYYIKGEWYEKGHEGNLLKYAYK